MTKHRHQQNRAHQSNRVDSSMSVGVESTDQIQGQSGQIQSPSEYGFAPNYEDIQRKAYQIHEEKGGGELENWLEAEQVLKEEHQVSR